MIFFCSLFLICYNKLPIKYRKSFQIKVVGVFKLKNVFFVQFKREIVINRVYNIV